MLHTRIYDVDANAPGSDQPHGGLAPAGAGIVQINLSGDTDATNRLTIWITRTFRSEVVTSGPNGRVSFEVRADEAASDAGPSS